MKLILHIGTEKTGTTNIQEWLYANKQMLEKNNYFISEILGKSNNRKLPSFFVDDYEDDYFKSNCINNQTSKEKYYENFESELRSEIENSKCQNFIITSEHFHSRLKNISQINNLKLFLKSFFEEIRIICFFRPQYEVIKSLYSTALKGTYSKNYNIFADELIHDEGYFNYYEICNKWSNVFGLENLKVVNFDKKLDVVEQFCKLVDPNLHLSYSESIKLPRLNESLHPRRWYLWQLINIYCNRKFDFVKSLRRADELKQLAINELANKELLDKKSDDNLLDIQQINFNNYYQHSNELFFQKYFIDKFEYPSLPCETYNNYSLSYMEINEFNELFIDLITKVKEDI